MNDKPILRESVSRFACVMEGVLRDNDHKGGWDDCEPGWLLRRMGQELAELRRAYGRRATCEEVRKECADVANFAMMLAERYQGWHRD